MLGAYRSITFLFLLACSNCYDSFGQAKVQIPRFEDYPARVQLAGPPKAPVLIQPEHRLYKTRLRRGVLHGDGLLGNNTVGSPPVPNFAGAFYAVTWGCGSDGCTALAIVDGRTGTVYGPPPDASTAKTGFVATPGTHECPGIGLRANSRLLFIDYADHSSEELTCRRTYYEWENGSYRFIKKISLKP